VSRKTSRCQGWCPSTGIWAGRDVSSYLLTHCGRTHRGRGCLHASESRGRGRSREEPRRDAHLTRGDGGGCGGPEVGGRLVPSATGLLGHRGRHAIGRRLALPCRRCPDFTLHRVNLGHDHSFEVTPGYDHGCQESGRMAAGFHRYFCSPLQVLPHPSGYA